VSHRRRRCQVRTQRIAKILGAFSSVREIRDTLQVAETVTVAAIEQGAKLDLLQVRLIGAP
jgi:hypothetical protein